ncbi:hypothetical protein RHS01_02424 [Rhizoctonia solani]|uniref:Nuclear speckle splicing regulatory protein 1 N-terminal domain-containing protein n=2 Tax=Rhizoctonia solani TaxID=456999 RepID=A0A8H7IIB7_9AGAM|nr:hypothetical protein RHS01_02424 [Rhizoctonia solani]
MSKLSFSLAKPKKDVQPVGTAPSLTRVALDDDNESSVLSGGGNGATQRKMDAELKVDSTVFQYDEVWDGMKLAEAKAKAQKEQSRGEKGISNAPTLNLSPRQPKYMKNLLDSAATRRLDHLRAEEKLMQREREAEGDEFADKEKFVTQAYKDQMAEVRRAEAEEKAREGASPSLPHPPFSFDSMWTQPDDTYIEAERKKNKGLGGGMTHFYKRMLEDSSRSHDAAVAATSSDPDPSSEPAVAAASVTRPARGPKPLEVAPNPDEVLKSGETRTNGETKTMITADGAEVEINDNNEVVDKRELLSAGLNLSAPNTRNLSLLRAIHGSGSKTTEEPVVAHRAAGVAASKEEIRKRQQRQLEAQLEEERKRVRDEQEREEREERERVVRRRNDESAVNDAKERYLARKRRKLEEEQQQEQQES